MVGHSESSRIHLYWLASDVATVISAAKQQPRASSPIFIVYSCCRRNTICASIVPLGCPNYEQRTCGRKEIYAKRRCDSSRRRTRTRCLGVQMARTGRGRQKKASQNSYRLSSSWQTKQPPAGQFPPYG